MAKHINDKGRIKLPSGKEINPTPGSKIALMGQTFTKEEIKKISIMWIAVPSDLRTKWKRTYKRFANIMNLIVKLAEQIDSHPDNRK